ncbi:MAG: PA domain-containing protein [Acidobacteriota bacterium]
MRKSFSLFFPVVLVASILLTADLANATRIIFNYVDPPGVGFNDATAATPVGGNRGRTIGEQRKNVFQFAARMWGRQIKSNVDITVTTGWPTLFCNAGSAVLGSSGAISIWWGFPNAARVDRNYNAALANALARYDLSPGPPDTTYGVPGNDEYLVYLNPNIGQPTCLAGSGWYYGLDHNEPAGKIDLLATCMHEFAHGLGWQAQFRTSLNDFYGAPPSIYSVYMWDNTLGMTFDNMTPAQRGVSKVNTDKLVWIGSNVTSQVPANLGPRPMLTVNSPAGIAGAYDVQTASFGPALTIAGLTGNVVLVNDGTGTPTYACSPLVNGPQVAGNIALIDRGTCTFTTKVKNAQNAGAIGAIVVNNVASGFPGMGGTDPTITIPSVGVTLATGNLIKANLATGVNATMALNPAFLAGADNSGRVLLYAPNPYASGSSLSHYDTKCTPNLLMEPSINADLHPRTTWDLTIVLMRDIGWKTRGTK